MKKIILGLITIGILGVTNASENHIHMELGVNSSAPNAKADPHKAFFVISKNIGGSVPYLLNLVVCDTQNGQMNTWDFTPIPNFPQEKFVVDSDILGVSEWVDNDQLANITVQELLSNPNQKSNDLAFGVTTTGLGIWDSADYTNPFIPLVTVQPMFGFSTQNYQNYSYSFKNLTCKPI